MAEGFAVKPQGQANAAVASADDETSLHSNPAGLARLHGLALGGGHILSYLDTRISYLDLASGLGNSGTLGVQVGYLSDTDTRRDAYGKDQGEFTNTNLLAGLAYALPLVANWRLGLGAKYLHESYAGLARSSLAGDLGLQASLAGGWQLGAAVQNFGAQLSSATPTYATPLRVQAGVASTFFLPTWVMELDLQALPFEGTARLLYGTTLSIEIPEWRVQAGPAQPNPQVHVRAGLAAGLITSEPTRLNLGAGLDLPPTYSVDYALVNQGILGNTHRFSLSLHYAGIEFKGPSGADLAAPYALKAAETLEGLVLEWQDVNEKTEGYNIYNETNIGPDRLTPRPTLKRRQKFKNVTRATTYKFFVRAVGSDGKEGPASEVMTWVVR